MISTQTGNVSYTSLPTEEVEGHPSFREVYDLAQKNLPAWCVTSVIDLPTHKEWMSVGWSFPMKGSPKNWNVGVGLYVNYTGRKLSAVYHGLTSDDGNLVITKTDLPKRGHPGDWKAALVEFVKMWEVRNGWKQMVSNLDFLKPTRQQVVNMMVSSGVTDLFSWSSIGKVLDEYHEPENVDKWSQLDLLKSISRSVAGSKSIRQLEGMYRFLHQQSLYYLGIHLRKQPTTTYQQSTTTPSTKL